VLLVNCLQLPHYTLDTPAVLSSKLSLPSVEVSKKLDFEEFPVEYSSFETKLKEENIDISSSPRYITGIEALDESFLSHWGDKKEFLYYITEFRSLKRKEGESISDFSKIFNKM
jgi:hypothetical protein